LFTITYVLYKNHQIFKSFSRALNGWTPTIIINFYILNSWANRFVFAVVVDHIRRITHAFIPERCDYTWYVYLPVTIKYIELPALYKTYTRDTANGSRFCRFFTARV